uniref:Neuropeptide S receptor 1 n=1 Tax=Phocoena sinus TaxID=42100 RepID=A0A8C9CPP1_PHOSS
CPPHLTEGSPKSNGTGQTLDSPILCTETVTFTAVVEGEERGSFYYSFKTEQLITLWVLFVFTIVGNAIMLFSTLRRKRKSRMTFFVAQLAITDSFTGLVNILTDIIGRFTGDFMAPDLVCQVVRYLQVVLLYASTYVLVSLSIDRYHAIVYPMKFLQGEKQAKVLSVIAWSLSFLFSIPTLIIFGKRKLSNGETPYITIVAFLVYFIPLTIIRLRGQQARPIQGLSRFTNCCSPPLQVTHWPPGLWAAMVLTALSSPAFICCWSPYFLFNILYNFSLLPNTKERSYASVIIQNLPPLNNAINPLIYCVFSSFICFPCGEQRSWDSRMTCQERTERHEMQILSKPEFM